MKELGELNTILFVVFIVLKLTGNVTWPWVWVLSPFWIPALIAILAAFYYRFKYRK